MKLIYLVILQNGDYIHAFETKEMAENFRQQLFKQKHRIVGILEIPYTIHSESQVIN